MSEGYKIVKKAMDELMKDQGARDRLFLPVSQVSKFEHWLKIELGYRLTKYLDDNEKDTIEFEPHYKGNDPGKRGDIAFEKSNCKYYIEIKTARSRRKIDNVNKISGNLLGSLIRKRGADEIGIIPDIKKLQGSLVHGIVIFIIFPLRKDVLKGDIKLDEILQSIRAASAMKEELIVNDKKLHFIEGRKRSRLLHY